MPDRILWLLNHKTLMKAEVPILMELGYEVFVPKIFPHDDANLSAEISFVYDETLTISKEYLEILNKHDFYSGKINGKIKRILNESFDAAICGFFPNMINMLVKSFAQSIYIRGFGLAGNEDYAHLIQEYCKPEVYHRFLTNNSIYFAPSYSNIVFNEPHWLAKKAVFLPLGLPPEMEVHKGTWTGSDNRILFVCPRIKSNSYYGNIYDSFKRNFGDLPHVIVGKQVVPVHNDPSVSGFVDQKTMNGLFENCSVLFYHSQELRHLHYHPLEAMLFGMPVIYMAGGLLDQIAGRRLPGCCTTSVEAHEKISRILSGDQTLVNQIISSQRKILDHFSAEEILKYWKKIFHPKRLNQKNSQLQSGEQAVINIGVWVHNIYPQHLMGEGINLVMGKTISALSTFPDIRIKIACLSWVKKDLLEFFNTIDVDETKLDFILVSEYPPFVFRIYEWYREQKNKTREKYKLCTVFRELSQDLYKLVEVIYGWVISIRTPAEVILVILLLPIVIAIIPFVLFGLLTYYIFRSLSNLIIKFSTKIKQIVGNRTQNFIQRFVRYSFHRIVENETSALIKKTQSMQDLDAWLVSYPNFPNIKQLKQPSVLVVPDLVYNEFPVPYARELPKIIEFDENIKTAIHNASHIVTYSEHVKENHLIKPGQRKGNTISVIRHAPISSKDILNSGQDLIITKYISSLIIKDYLKAMYDKKPTQELLYQKGLPWGDFDFIFISSQTRPHKNHLNILKAYRVFLREKYKNCKLIFTGEFSDDMKEYIAFHGLQYDVLSITRIPPYEHAAFFAGAKLAVAPTLFEGGFPFLFSQALSVDTPILMSDIPVVREMLGENDVCTFNPYSIQDIVDKLVWVWDNYFSLLEHQKMIYDQMTCRSWADVANEYRCIFTLLLGDD